MPNEVSRELIEVSARSAKSDCCVDFVQEVSMPVSRRHSAPNRTQKPVCIIDDDECVVDSLKTLLESFGFSVLSYTSGREFLADVQRRAAGCLVIDHHMPGMTGLDVLVYLQKEGTQIPSILISGRLDAKIRERAARLGVSEIVEKPFAATRLIELIRTTLPEHG
jgi:two-component system, LuxR family, response regulator FixJ